MPASGQGRAGTEPHSAEFRASGRRLSACELPHLIQHAGQALPGACLRRQAEVSGALGLVERLLSSQESGAVMMTELLQFTPQPLSFGLSVAFVLGSMSLGAIASWRAASAFLRRDV